MYLDLGSASAVLNIVAALGVVAIAQAVTRDYDRATEIGWVKFFHRMSMLALAGMLSYNAYRTLDMGTEPRLEDVLVQIAVAAVVVISFLRHLMSPRHNREIEMRLRNLERQADTRASPR